MRSTNECYPFFIFAVLLTVQWGISFTLPETKDKQMPQEMPKDEKLHKKTKENAEFELI